MPLCVELPIFNNQIIPKTLWAKECLTLSFKKQSLYWTVKTKAKMWKAELKVEFRQAQNDMNYNYFGGGPGIFASGVVWVISGIFALTVSSKASMLSLFLGGMFIHPLGILLSKALKRPGKHTQGNPLGKLALESTFVLFVGMFIAYAVSFKQADWFFPIMLMIIGSRYLVFSTVYGNNWYWVLGGLLGVCGVLCVVFQLPFALGAFAGGALEIFFSIIFLFRARHMGADS